MLTERPDSCYTCYIPQSSAKNMVAFREWDMGSQSIQGSFLPHGGLRHQQTLLPLITSSEHCFSPHTTAASLSSAS